MRLFVLNRIANFNYKIDSIIDQDACQEHTEPQKTPLK